MHADLNVATAWFDENIRNGLMICGINWGGDASGDAPRHAPSFFSDHAANRFPYRNRILTWFSLFGHPLQTVAGREGGFERSIVQTNWLDTQSPNMQGKALHHEFVGNWENMAHHLDALRPRLILFLSATLLDALNSPGIFPEAQHILGCADRPLFLQKEVTSHGRRLKRFRVGMQDFEHTSVIALPHPTGSKGLSNEYISAFAPEISAHIANYKESRNFVTR